MNDKPEGELSFDRAIPVTPVSMGVSGVTCANCKRALGETYHTANGEPICEDCSAVLRKAAAGVTEPATIVKALVPGLVATIAGALVYWATIRFFNLEIGLVAILSGWMIGKALSGGAGGRGGIALQVLGAGLVYVSVALAYFPFIYEAASSVGEPLSSAIGGALAQPIRGIFGTGAGGIISALILGFGMMQAWQMTRQPAIRFEGPFRVGGTTGSSAGPASA